jgi:hypothetical protein
VRESLEPNYSRGAEARDGRSPVVERRLEMDFGGCLLLAWAVFWVVCGTLHFWFSVLDILVL